MSSSSLIRWSGLTAAAGGLLLAVYDVFTFSLPPLAEALNQWTAAYGLLMAATLLGLLGLIGLYATQIRETGVLGLLAFVVAFEGLILFFAFAWGGVVLVPTVVAAAPDALANIETPISQFVFSLHQPLTGIGFLIFGLVSLRGNVLSRWGSGILVLGSFLGALSALNIFDLLPVGESAIAGVGFAWMGFVLWRGKAQP